MLHLATMTSEYYTEALVLDKEPVGEADSRVFLYTRDLGRIAATAVSARKITSKLSSHLEPLNFVKVRMIHKNRFQIVDALKTESLPKNPNNVAIAHLIKDLTGDEQSDPQLWELLREKQFSGEEILSALGFDISFCFL